MSAADSMQTARGPRPISDAVHRLCGAGVSAADGTRTAWEQQPFQRLPSVTDGTDSTDSICRPFYAPSLSPSLPCAFPPSVPASTTPSSNPLPDRGEGGIDDECCPCRPCCPLTDKNGRSGLLCACCPAAVRWLCGAPPAPCAADRWTASPPVREPKVIVHRTQHGFGLMLVAIATHALVRCEAELRLVQSQPGAPRPQGEGDLGDHGGGGPVDTMLCAAEERAQRGRSSIPPDILRRIDAARFNPEDEEVYEPETQEVTRPRTASSQMTCARRTPRSRARRRARRAARRAGARGPSGDDGSAPPQLTYTTERGADAWGAAEDQAAHATYETTCWTDRSHGRLLTPGTAARARLSRLSGGAR